MDQKNLADLYGLPPIPWSRVLEALETQVPEANTLFLATTRPDGRPHVAGVGALWDGGRMYFVSGPGTRKSKNLAANPNCAIAVSLPGIDLVVEGAAERVTDESTLNRLAKRYADSGWPASVQDGAFTYDFSAPSAGPPPWYLYEVRPTTVFGVLSAENEAGGATRWRFDD
jgi:general stress protein 26